MNRFLSFFITFSVIVLSCRTTTKVPQSADQQGSKLKKNQMIGVVVLKSITSESRSTESNIKELFFKINETDYFIKINEGYVTPSELLKYLNKEIIVKAEKKDGQWEMQEPSSIKDGKQVRKARSGPYVAIYKIYK